MHLSLLQIVEKTTHHIKDYVEGVETKLILKELTQILFDQFKEVADAHQTFLRCIEKASKAHKFEMNSYDIQFLWSQVQDVVSESCINIFNLRFKMFIKLYFLLQLQSFLTDYLDIQNMSSDLQISDIIDTNDLSIYFSRRKQPTYVIAFKNCHRLNAGFKLRVLFFCFVFNSFFFSDVA